MRLRTQSLGTRNLVGARVEQIRREKGLKQAYLVAKLQVRGINLNSSAISKIEGQVRGVSDIELAALADILGVPVDRLLGRGGQTS